MAATLSLPRPAEAVTEAEIRELREQLQQMKREYEQRIEALEKRLQRAEGIAAKADDAAAAAGAQALKAESVAVQAGSRSASESAFNPAVSLILNGVYGNLSQDPARYRITGFTPTGGEVGPGKRG